MGTGAGWPFALWRQPHRYRNGIPLVDCYRSGSLRRVWAASATAKGRPNLLSTSPRLIVSPARLMSYCGPSRRFASAVVKSKWGISGLLARLSFGFRLEKPRSRMVAEQFGITHITAQCVHALVAANVHQLKIDAPRAAAEVKKPDLSECPLKSDAFSPARRA
jgi:hypothetical protein